MYLCDEICASAHEKFHRTFSGFAMHVQMAYPNYMGCV